MLKKSYPVYVESTRLVLATNRIVSCLYMPVHMCGGLGLGSRSKEKERGSIDEMHIVMIGRLKEAKSEEETRRSEIHYREEGWMRIYTRTCLATL